MHISFYIHPNELKELNRMAQKAGVSRSTYIKQALNLKGITGSNTIPTSIHRFAKGTFFSLKNGVYTTRKHGLYKHRAAGGSIVYEYRVDLDDQVTILKHRPTTYGSVFYDDMGQFICQVTRGHDLYMDHEYVTQLSDEAKLRNTKV